jgi:hypothetical protein
LKNETGLACALTGLIAAYWTGKVIIQFFYYPMYDIPKKLIFKVGGFFMNVLFAVFEIVFIWLFVNNLIGYFA